MFNRIIKPLKSNSFFLFGARGTGKTTFLNQKFSSQTSYTIDLLDASVCAELQARPDHLSSIVQQNKREWIIIDEIQKIPPLLDEVHRMLERSKQKFILTGSSARKLKRGAANLLAGRAFVFKMFPLTHLELAEEFDLDEVLSFGSLPKIFSLKTVREKTLFLRAYADTYLKEEVLIEQLIRNLPPFRRFLEVSAHQDTELVSYTNVAKDILVDPKIATNYYEILEDTLLGFKLEPYHTAIRKRQKKSPKFYWFDLGVRRVLAGTIDDKAQRKSYEYGSLFESFIVNEIYRSLAYSERSFSVSFLRVDEKTEADLILERNGLPTYVVELKSTDRVHEGHVQGAKKIFHDINNSIPVVLSNDPLAKKIEGISCWHWKHGLKEMGI